MIVRPVSDALGVEVLNFKLTNTLPQGQINELKELIHEHKVVVFREQELTPEQQIEVCRQFGEIEPHPLKANTCPHPEMTIVSNATEDGEAVGYPGPKFELWHSDMCYEQNPPMFSFLYAEKVPTVGGNTLFANTVAAYEALDEHVKDQLRGKKATFGFSEALMARCRAKGYDLVIDEVDQRPDAIHDVIQTHPVTGKPSIFVNWTHTNEIIDCDNSDELLDQLYEHCRKPEFVYSHQYQKNDLIVWDNAGSIHTGDGTVEMDRVRIMRRVVVRWQ